MSEISIDIEEEKENKNLKRRELVLTVNHESDPTPTRDQIRKDSFEDSTSSTASHASAVISVGGLSTSIFSSNSGIFPS